ncbi:hypothetical protein [Halorubrum distributum]|uniref:Uncharacterized protein n=1 Tax=Halorubrum distributum TaxID=29283 RepID=A0A6B1IJ12_9EURY|nr:MULTISPECIES: hypothetical protein [Halorubrum distributum group]MDV7349929.1 hypothetical protein [Halorubrum distributum]MYL16718.1 hypothetical protein [Halorubrum terrestre]MYL66968.1 hypothetical protein [Halorubrum terrestre]
MTLPSRPRERLGKGDVRSDGRCSVPGAKLTALLLLVALLLLLFLASLVRMLG